MKKRQIVNIVNFVRAVEPRLEMDLITPVKEQIRLMREHGLRGTFLIQYDALLLDEYTELFRELDSEQFELGLWYEIVEQQVRACGIEWRGRYSWDWHTHCGFSVGYTAEERERLADEAYRKFNEVFGYYPRVFGSWLFDTHTVRYISDKYGMDAMCNCKDQFGTDGYTLWGGYYGQGYYPSRSDVFVPARTVESGMNVPLFRMLGSDPVYQYDLGIDVSCDAPRVQNVLTLEPACAEAGGNPEWIDWFLRENFNGDCLSFGYAQAGQENSFGWQGMSAGLEYQFAAFERLQRGGLIEVEPLGDTGRWFKSHYTVTPASSIVAHDAYDDNDRSSVWYSSRFYRVNIYCDHGRLRIRDLHAFSDTLRDEYENKVCTENYACYESLPYIDGSRYSGRGVLAGGYIIFSDGSEPICDKMEFTDLGDGCAALNLGAVRITLSEDKIHIACDRPFTLENRIGIDGSHMWSCRSACSDRLELSYGETDYSIVLSKGKFISETVAESDGGTLELIINP